MTEVKKEHEIRFSVNDEDQTTTKEFMTPIEIMQLAGVDPQTNYLKESKGKGKESVSYKDNPAAEIKMHNNMKFATFYTGATPVSAAC